MTKDTADRDRRIYSEYMRLRDSTRYNTPDALHQALGVMFGGENAPLSPNTIRKILGRQRRVDYAETNGLPLDAVPPGFFVKKVSTLLDADGNTITQSVQAVNESRRTTEHQDAIPQGHGVKGVSTYLDEQGRVRGQWVKTDRQQQQWLDIVNGVLERIPKLVTPLPRVAKPKLYVNDLLALYPLADLHVGLYASLMDAERHWRLDTAVEMYKRLMDDLIARTPKAAHAIIGQVGDFTHVDNQTNATPTSGARLDVDGKFVEISQAAFELAVYAINGAARHHQNVTVIWLGGNHDPNTALVMQTALAMMYRNDARIHVVTTGRYTHCVQHGQVALGFTHGDTIKPKDLVMNMAVDYPHIWAATTYHVWHTGHLHHKKVEEFPGGIVECHESPAPRDTWHEVQGYRSMHSLCSIVYDQIGEYSRNTVQVRPPPPKESEPNIIDGERLFRADNESEVKEDAA